jgi:hypothetical protein
VTTVQEDFLEKSEYGQTFNNSKSSLPISLKFQYKAPTIAIKTKRNDVKQVRRLSGLSNHICRRMGIPTAIKPSIGHIRQSTKSINMHALLFQAAKQILILWGQNITTATLHASLIS